MSLFQPEKFFERVTQIDIQNDLCAKGYFNVLIDMDNTILSRETHSVPDDVLHWLRQAQDAGIKFCILSNNWHKSAYVQGASLNFPVVAKAIKPFIHGYVLGCNKLGGNRNNTIMIGDQLFTDIVGAHLYRMSSYMVGPLSEKDLKHTLFVRKIEYALMHKLS